MEQIEVIEYPAATTESGGSASGAARAYERDADPRSHGPSHEEIAALAYSYWEQRGGEDGSAEQDWYRAERTLTQPKTPEPS